MNNKVVAGLGLAIGLSVLGSNVGNAVVVSQSPLASQYKDGRYNTVGDSTTLGYKVGQTTYDKYVVTDVRVKLKSTFTQLDKESDSAKYSKSLNDGYKNMFVGKNSSGTWLMPMRLNYDTQLKFNQNKYISPSKLNDEFLKLLNAERVKKGLKPLKYASNLQEGANTRSQELANYGSIRVGTKSHVRLDGRPFYTAYSDKINVRNYSMGENLAMNGYLGNPYQLLSEKRLASDFFNQWKNSPGHYQNMMGRQYTKSTIAIKISSDNKLSSNFDMLVGTQVLSS